MQCERCEVVTRDLFREGSQMICIQCKYGRGETFIQGRVDKAALSWAEATQHYNMEEQQ